MHIHRAGLYRVIRIPNGLQQLFPAEGHAGMGQKQPQKFIFLIGQGNPLTIDGDGVLALVQRQAVQFQKRRRLLWLASAQNGLHPGHHLHHAEGLGDVVVGAQIQTLYLVKFRAPGGGHNHGNVPVPLVGAQPLQNRHAVLSGQHHVQNHQLRLLLLQSLPEFGPVGKAPGLQPGGMQGIYFNFPNARVVLYTPDHAHISLFVLRFLYTTPFGPKTQACYWHSSRIPVRENSTHSAMFVQWSPMRSKYLAIISRSSAYSPSPGLDAIMAIMSDLTSLK